MTRDEAKSVLATVLRYTACDSDYAYDKEDGGVELVSGQGIADALDMAIAALNEQEKRRWIPVTERLPEMGSPVLVRVNGKPCKNIMLKGAYELAEYDPEGWILEMWPEWMDADVTHWMPLPQPPKGE